MTSGIVWRTYNRSSFDFVWSAYIPVINDTLDGPQSGYWTCALLKSMPFLANLSILGVIAKGSPYAPKAQFKSSATMNRTLSLLADSISFVESEDLTPKITIVKKN